MALDAVIRCRDRQPLGTLEQAKTQIEKAFPGTQFKFVQDETPSWLSPALPLLKLLESRHPCWEGTFDGDMFIAVFDLGAGPLVDAVRVTLYGQGTTNAEPHFAALCEEGLGDGVSGILGNSPILRALATARQHYAVFSALSPSFLIVSSRITNFWILPVMVIGNSGTNSM
jgi:hypothetical protein